MKLKIKKGDTVIVITGKDKGKIGSVIKVDPKAQKIIVNDVNLAKKHTKPSQSGEGGIIQEPLPIHISNVAHLDPESNKPSKVSFSISGDGTKNRILKRSGKAVHNENKI